MHHVSSALPELILSLQQLSAYIVCKQLRLFLVPLNYATKLFYMWLCNKSVLKQYLNAIINNLQALKINFRLLAIGVLLNGLIHMYHAHQYYVCTV